MSDPVSDPGCEEYRELASGFVDERLEGAELLRFERHIEACAACRRFEAGLRRFRQLLRAAAAVQPLRRPPPGFAAGVAARVMHQAAPATVPFPRHGAGRRPVRVLAGLAAAAAAALFFVWSWQRLLPVEEPARRVAAGVVAPAPQRFAVAEEGNMDSWMRQHVLLARDGTLLGPAEEVEFASYQPAASER